MRLYAVGEGRKGIRAMPRFPAQVVRLGGGSNGHLGPFDRHSIGPQKDLGQRPGSRSAPPPSCQLLGTFCHFRWQTTPPQLRDEPNIQDPHRIAQCPAAPDVLWAQHHNGIFHTTDAGQFWGTIPQAGPSTFGFAVAVHPRNPETAWFVPAISDELRVPVDAKVVVTRTRDGGRTFQTLTEGLPRQKAYDLVYRHSLDVDATGNRLAFGSTTGGLWISENGGDAWQMLPTRLPPVYCVRFGV